MRRTTRRFIHSPAGYALVAVCAVSMAAVGCDDADDLETNASPGVVEEIDNDNDYDLEDAFDPSENAYARDRGDFGDEVNDFDLEDTLDPTEDANAVDRERLAMNTIQDREPNSRSVAGNRDRDREVTTNATAEGDWLVMVDRTQDTRKVRAGEPFEYKLNVTNTASTPLYNVKVKEVATGAFEYDDTANAQKRGQWKYDDHKSQPTYGYERSAADSDEDKNEKRATNRGQMTETSRAWTVGMLGPGETKTITVSGVAHQEGQVETCVTVDYDPVWCSAVSVVKPELQVRVNTPEQAYICDDIPVRFRLENTGSGSTHAADFMVQLPDGLTTADGNREVRINAGEIASGDFVEKDFVLRAEKGGEFDIEGRAKTDALEARAKAQSVDILDPELKLTVDGHGEQYLGRTVDYSITVKNTSDDPAIKTWMELDLPDNAERVTWSTQAAERDGDRMFIGQLNPGESRSFNVSFDATEIGSTFATVKASAYCAETLTEEIRTEVKGISAVQLECIDATDPVEVDGTTFYEVRVKNEGSAPDMNVKVNATLPEQLAFVDATGDSKVTANGQRLDFAPIKRLDPGEIATWRVQVRAKDAGKVHFALEMTSDANKRAVVEEEPTTLY
ncbi:MAG: hypothetical protein ACF8PN_04100 [Phycisphaerales bacterium]